jgi:hypothetical protein
MVLIYYHINRSWKESFFGKVYVFQIILIEKSKMDLEIFHDVDSDRVFTRYILVYLS